MNAFIFVRGDGFLFDDNIRMRCHNVLVIKRDVTDDIQTVGENAKLEDIAKMLIDIKLLGFRISRRMGRHAAIGNYVEIIRFIKALNLCTALKLKNAVFMRFMTFGKRLYKNISRRNCYGF